MMWSEISRGAYMCFSLEASGRDFSGVCATVRALVRLPIAFFYALSVATLLSLLGATSFFIVASRSDELLPRELVTQVGLLMKKTRSHGPEMPRASARELCGHSHCPHAASNRLRDDSAAPSSVVFATSFTSCKILCPDPASTWACRLKNSVWIRENSCGSFIRTSL